MSDQRDGGIAWTDQTWNPVRGCSVVSAGCEHCYAMSVAARFSGPGLAYEGLARRSEKRGLPQWTGVVRLVPEHLGDPLRWKRPRRVFVNSMSDPFHEGLTNEQIAAVFGVMAASPRHTFQCLTKRSKRMREWFSRDVDHATDCGEAAARAMGDSFASFSFGAGGPWPLPNVHLGVSCEDQAAAESRVPDLLATPAAVRFVSAEPLLGPVTLNPWLFSEHGRRAIGAQAGLSWVICGGESGPSARPCDVAWIRSIVKQCREASVPVFVKQLGANVWTDDWRGTLFVPPDHVPLRDRKGGAIQEWPEDLRVREFPR